jgi:putative ABC transport system permease protein
MRVTVNRQLPTANRQPPTANRQPKNMFKNYFKVAIRNLRNNKVFASLNIAGLAIGMATAILIGLWISDELSYDHYNPHHERLAKMMITQTHGSDSYTGTTIAMPLGYAMESKYKDLFKRITLVSFHGLHVLAIGDKKISGSGIYAQELFPSMFGLTILNGNIQMLNDPSTIMIARSLAVSLFGNENPVNKTVLLDSKLNMKVGAVYEDLPENSSFAATALLLPWTNSANSYLSTNTNWQDHNGEGFVELNDQVTTTTATEKIKNLPTPFIKDWQETALVYPLDKLHLYGEFANGKPAGGRIQFVVLMGFIGAFVLLLACINFMNLSTARSSKRAKEVGIRKTIGSRSIHLIGQFLIESVCLTLIAFSIALLLAQLSLSFFNNLAGKHIFIPYGNPVFWLLCVGFALFTGLISGSYPAFYLSRFEPVKVLKGAFQGSRYNSIPRQVLVVMQFTVSLSLIIGTIVVYRQILYAKNRPTGYTREGLVTLPLSEDLYGHYDALRENLLRTGAVTEMAESSQPITNFDNNNGLDWRGKDPGLVVFFRNVNVTPEFGRTVSWKIKEGRDFSRAFSDSNSMILSEAAAKVTGISHPVGEIMKFGGKNRTVIGIVQDLLTNSPYDNVEPAIFLGDGYMSVITIRMKAGIPVPIAMTGIEKVFKKYNPGSPFIFQYNDDIYANKFAPEERVANLSAVFAGMAIFISCLGLFGLASFVAEQRTKEIGVRKVLGATMFSLWKMLSTQFVKLVLISLCIAIPLSYYGMNLWLQDYTYRDSISWWIFAAAGFSILLITLLTVSYQSIKAALMNPVNSLRSE